MLDTQILIWVSLDSPRLPPGARELIGDRGNQLLFSAASIWEVAIKTSRGRPDFEIDPSDFRHRLLSSGYVELPVTGDHAVNVATLPRIHRDPFDRILIAQAQSEAITLLTADETVARYPGPIRQERNDL